MIDAYSFEWCHCRSSLTLNPKTTLISIFCAAFNIFVVDELKDFKFGVQVDHMDFQPTDDELSLKGAWSRHVTHFKFLVPIKYLWNGFSYRFHNCQ